MSDSRALALTLVNQRAELPRLAEAVEHFAEEQRLSFADLNAINLVLDEVVMNVISHGYDDAAEHRIEVEVQVDDDRVTMKVSDDGKAFDPTTAPPPRLDAPIEERQIGGLGVHIVKALGCSMHYLREDGRNILTITKPLHTGTPTE